MKIVRYALLVALVLLPIVGQAQEKYALTTPQARTSVAEIQIRLVVLNWETQSVTVSWKDNAGGEFSHTYASNTTPTGRTLMVALNRADLTTRSLYKRVLERLAADGVIAPGTVTGAPE